MVMAIIYIECINNSIVVQYTLYNERMRMRCNGLEMKLGLFIRSNGIANKNLKENEIMKKYLSAILTFVVFGVLGVMTLTIGQTGNMILIVTMNIGYYALLAKGTFDIIQCTKNGDSKKIKDVTILYSLIYSIALFLPFVLHVIKNLF